MSAVRDQLYLGTLSRVVVVIYSPALKPLERFVFDVDRFPVVPKNEREAVMEREGGTGAIHITREQEQTTTTTTRTKTGETTTTEKKMVPTTKAEQEKQADDIHERLRVEMSHSFRGLLARLSFLNGRLKKLPKHCSFNVVIELKEEAPVPSGHSQPWIPSEPSQQVSASYSSHDTEDEPPNIESHDSEFREGGEAADSNAEGPGNAAAAAADATHQKDKTAWKRGEDLGGARTTPIRTVEAGEMLFEVWVEEGKAKFEKTRRRGNLDNDDYVYDGGGGGDRGGGGGGGSKGKGPARDDGFSEGETKFNRDFEADGDSSEVDDDDDDWVDDSDSADISGPEDETNLEL